MDAFASGGPDSRSFVHTASSALSHSSDSWRSLALAVSSEAVHLSRPRGCQGRGAGGVVAVLGLTVVGELGIVRKGLGEQFCRV